MSIRFGMRRMALINSAGYDRAIIPLDASVGLLADNNIGKTSLVNALQFPLVPDRRRLSFGANSLEASRAFYFPYDSSYVLVELLTPGGTVVVGCVGVGADHDFAHFAYAGGLDLNDFRGAGGDVVKQASLVQHMVSRGHAVFRYRSEEFRDRLFCRARNVQAGEPDFGLFRVRQDQEIDSFQTIFTRVLRLDDLTVDSIKRDLLDIYRSDLKTTNVNFKLEWDQAFQAVNRDIAQLEAAKGVAAEIDRIALLRDQRIELRSIVVHQMGLIDAALEGWEQHHFAELQSLQGQAALLERERKDLDGRSVSEAEKRSASREALKQLEGESKELASLAGRFIAGAADRESLAAALEIVGRKKHQLAIDIQNGQTASVSTLERNVARGASELRALVTRRDAASTTLHAALERALPADALEGIARALSHNALTLPGDRFEIDALVMQAAMAGAGEGSVTLPGLVLDVSGLDSQFGQRTAEELSEDIALAQKRVDADSRSLEAARSFNLKQGELEDLIHDESEARRRLERFDRYETLLKLQPDRVEATKRLEGEIQELTVLIDTVQEQSSQLRVRVDTVARGLEQLDLDNTRVLRLQAARPERASKWLANMEHKERHESYTRSLAGDIPLSLLREAMDAQDQRSVALERAERESDGLLKDIHLAGLTKFAGEGGDEEEIVKIIRYHEHRASEEATIANAQRAASVSVSSALAHLRDGLRSFESKVSSFNRLITRRRISDLSVFRINIVREQRLVDDIEAVLSGMDDADSQQMGLLGAAGKGTSVTARAINNLRAQHELKVDSLFSLEFEIGKEGHVPLRHRQMKGAASEGTSAMAKLVVGLAMLSELRDPRHEVRAACYLDEASKLDPRNQKALIEVAESFGFSLVMAAPQQLITPAYCVPIDIVGTKTRIDECRWVAIHQRMPAATAEPELEEATV